MNRFRFTRCSLLKDVMTVLSDIKHDERGEFWNLSSSLEFSEPLSDMRFCESVLSVSRAKVFRGLHFQKGMSKLVRCLRGNALAFVVDIRHGSPTFALYETVPLTSAPYAIASLMKIGRPTTRALFVPDGFAYGFMSLEHDTMMLYQMSDIYRPELEGAIRWNDPEVNLPWSGAVPNGLTAIVSERDAEAPFLYEYMKNPVYVYDHGAPVRD